MAILSLIAAIDELNAIGKNNKLLCFLPKDLNNFKKITQGHTVIMGRKTYESLPNGALPNRRNIVISRNSNFVAPNCEVVSSLGLAIEKCNLEPEVFVIGGATIYCDAMNIADKLYITHINHIFEGADTFFPLIDPKLWDRISSEYNVADEKNKYSYNFVVYRKK